ncbi:SDR family NAD(P)-dependent oxidoreductase [Oceanobacter mangrovi]|uniref:SDR family NAD(P)-dependent oxidoreductase n=1 Tax=Oceanobacter mangrovi TaxID=2862510 RepID=UPI001FEAF3C4|nr:SDR family NAD(P)-dependent oxidoreductase [Oceanobacter mangrovi]
MFDLTGKTALITGASRGLGQQIAAGFLKQGARVVITARKAAELAEAKAELLPLAGNDSSRIISWVSDLQDLDSIPGMVEQLLAEVGRIDILVNNAGTSWGAPMEEHPLDGWNKVMTLNITAPFVLTREIGRQCMIPNRYGKIINIASIGGLAGNRPELDMNTISYNTSKAAMINFTKALASEWGKYDINVNALCPGFFHSKLSAKLLESIADKVLPSVPLKRFGSETDLQGPAVFLAADASRHVTGTALAVDGGVTCA